MAGSKKSEKYSAKVTEDTLNVLFKELVDGCRDDLSEAQVNVDLYFNEITAPGTDGKAMYGSLYNDSLKIKGSVRTRQLQLLSLFKERVTTKEKVELDANKGKTNKDSLSPERMNDLLNDMEFSQKLLNAEVEITNITPAAPIDITESLEGVTLKKDDPEDTDYLEGDEDFDENEPEDVMEDDDDDF
jgi:hypothetical protein